MNLRMILSGVTVSGGLAAAIATTLPWMIYHGPAGYADMSWTAWQSESGADGRVIFALAIGLILAGGARFTKAGPSSFARLAAIVFAGAGLVVWYLDRDLFTNAARAILDLYRVTDPAALVVKPGGRVEGGDSSLLVFVGFLVGAMPAALPFWNEDRRASASASA